MVLSMAAWSTAAAPRFRRFLPPRRRMRRAWTHGGGRTKRFGPLSLRSRRRLCPGLGRSLRHAGPAVWRSGFARRASISWRERWSGRLIGLAFAGGVLLTACADYFTNHAGPTDPDAPLAAGTSEAFTAQALLALKAFGSPPATPRLSPGGAQPVAAPILPALPAAGQTLAAVRTMPGEQGQMLCMFYTRKAYGTITLCAEKTPGPIAAAPRSLWRLSIGRDHLASIGRQLRARGRAPRAGTSRHGRRGARPSGRLRRQGMTPKFCPVRASNRTKMFHVKRFGTIDRKKPCNAVDKDGLAERKAARKFGLLREKTPGAANG